MTGSFTSAFPTGFDHNSCGWGMEGVFYTSCHPGSIQGKIHRPKEFRKGLQLGTLKTRML